MTNARTARVAQAWLALMLCLTTVLQLLPPPVAAAAPSAVTPQPCALYPVGLARTLLTGRAPGDTLTAPITGPRGGMRWLSWAGDLSIEALVQSLLPPGNSSAYRNPANPGDQVLDPGDKVTVRPGAPSAAELRAAIDALKQLDITVPIGQPAGNGAAAPFVADGFARVRILSYGAEGLGLRFLGLAGCDPVPVAEAASAATDEDTSVAIALRGSRAGSASLVFQVGAPARGALSALADQSCETRDRVTSCVATVVYSPAANVSGVDTFSYTVSDGKTTSAPAQVALTIRPVNDSPLAADDAAALDEDGAVTIDVLANDQDADADPLSVSAVGAPAHGAAQVVGGQVRYTPAANASGADSFGYTVSDGKGGSATAMVYLTVNPLNDAPQLAAEPAAVGVAEDSPAQTIRLTAADVETPAGELAIALTALPQRGTLARADGALVTTSDLLPNPVELVYTPAADASGDDLLAAAVTDGGEGPDPARSTELTVSIRLSPIDDAPTAAPRKLEDLRRGVPAQVELQAADVDSAALSFALVAAPAHGQLGALGEPQCAPAGAGVSCTVAATYTPDADFAGEDSFTYAASADGLTSAPATVQIVTANAAPAAAGQPVSGEEDTALAITLQASDPDGDALSFVIVDGPAHGALTLDGASAQYIPAPNYHGPDSFSFRASDGLAQSEPATVAIAVAPRNDAPAFGPEASNSAQAIDEGEGLTALTASDIDGDALSFSVAEGALPAGLALEADGSFAGAAAAGSAGTYNLLIAVADGAGGSATASLVIEVAAPAVPLPPDPGTVAPPVSAQTATSVADATAFLYSGPNPIQTGVAPGTIDSARAGVLRGRVSGRDGQPIGGVTVAVKDHPELGSTLTRADGRFDLAVNGGSKLTLDYTKPGLLPAQRTVEVAWEAFVQVPEVVMIGLDGAVTPLELGAGQPLQVARANPVSDEDGARRATLLFPAGVTATMVLPDGSQQPLTSLHVRATEYTVGARGPETMPGELPANSGYTYAAELSVDEAIAAGATEVRFSQPVPFYIENFLNFPVGVAVPAGYYSREQARWIGAENGRVIKILAEAAGLASLDIDGSGAAATPAALAALGITEAELAQLAALYEPGQSLWRTPIPHFTPWDCNFPWGPPMDSLKPNQGVLNGPQEEPQDNLPVDDDPTQCGSVIGCVNQSLGERIRVIGTPYNLAYQSDRTSGYSAGRVVEIPLSGPTIPASVRSIKLEVSVAGQFFSQRFAAAPNQRYTFVWDGKDVYGRTLQGRHTVSVRVGYDYPLVYYASPEQHSRAWARVAGAAYTAVVSNRRGESITIWQDWKGQVSNWSTTTLGAEGWDLDIHHHYDPAGRVLLLGDGTQRSAASVDALVMNTVAGNPTATRLGDDGPAMLAKVMPHDVEVGPDGTIYFAEMGTHRVRKITPDGLITTIAGNGIATYKGDGGPAKNASLNFPIGLDLAPDGSIYIADSGNDRIRKVDPNGIITTVAGGGGFGTAGDNGPAIGAQLGRPEDVAVAPDGSFYIADTQTFRIRKVNPDGVIFTIAGTTTTFIDDGRAYLSSVGRVRSLELGPDGSLYLSGSFERVRRISTDGRITTVAGRGSAASTGDGGPAKDANVTGVYNIAIDQYNGDLYIAESQRLRRVRNGIISTIAGDGGRCVAYATECPEGGLAAASKLSLPGGVAVGPDGAIYLGENVSGRVRRLASFLPRAAATGEGNLFIPSEGGHEVYRFLPSGRHTQTIDALTGAVIFSFGYDQAGRLSAVTDRDGRVTTIERDAQGRATAIVAPTGQRTQLSIDGAGELQRVDGPGEQSYLIGYGQGRLLTSFTAPGNATSTITYDARGRLLSDRGPDGSGVTLARTDVGASFQVSLTSSMGRARTYLVEQLPTGDRRITATAADGSVAVELRRANGSRRITAPDGTVTELTVGPDPRWGMAAPVVRTYTRRSPAGLQSAASASVTAQLASPSDRLTLTAATRTLVRNGQTTTIAYDGARRTLTTTSAGGRVSVITLNALGRPVEYQQPGMLSQRYGYDQRGRLASVTQGDRVWTYSYDDLDRLTRLTDPLNRSVSFEYDAAGRVTRQIRPDNASIVTAYTAAGDVAAITPPGREAHSFSHTSAGLLAGYAAPQIGGEAAATAYSYNLDRQLLGVERPGGEAIGFAYDVAGRLQALQLGAESLAYAYNPQTGALSGVTAADGGTITYGYDGSLLTGTTWAGRVAGSLGWSYTSDLRVAQVRLNGAALAGYAYDPDGLMRSAGALSLARNPQSGAVQSATLGAVVTSFTYDNFGDTATTATAFGATPLLSVEFTRDALGRVAERRETIGGQSVSEAYRYDLAGRLVEVRRDGAVVASYGYDANGNRTSASDGAGQRAASYDGQDRLTQLGDTTYAYAPNGELRTRSAGGQSTSYQYDLQGSLRAVTLPDGTAITYVVDGEGRRIGKAVNGALVQGFLYDGDLRPVAELDGSGAVVSSFVYGRRANVPEYMLRGGATYRIVTDERGSPRLVVNAATGEVAQRMDYDVWGRVTADSNPGFQPFGFAGGLYDRHTGLVRLGARDYDADAGRWTARDPIGFRGGLTNLYSYVGGDPVNATDPTGRYSLDDAKDQWEEWKKDLSTQAERLRISKDIPDPVEDKARDMVLDKATGDRWSTAKGWYEKAEKAFDSFFKLREAACEEDPGRSAAKYLDTGLDWLGDLLPIDTVSGGAKELLDAGVRNVDAYFQRMRERLDQISNPPSSNGRTGGR